MIKNSRGENRKGENPIPYKKFYVLMTLFAIIALLSVALMVITGQGILATGMAAGGAAIFLVVGQGILIHYQAGFFADEITLHRERERQLEMALRQKEESQRAAEEANRVKSMLLANISNEIRNPINTMLGMDEMILRESNSKELTEYAVNIKNVGNILLSLMNDILDFSKIEAGKLEIEEGEYDLRDVIRELIHMVNPLAAEKNLETKLVVDENIPRRLWGDAPHLMQVILNILSNAVKYTPLGSVTFSLKCGKETKEETELWMSVEDTGIGIRKEDIQELFAPIQEMNYTRNPKIQGTGLGLAITREILKKMGTDLEVESEYGQGSVFSFRVKQKKLGEERLGGREMILDITNEAKQGEERRFLAPNAKLLAVDGNKMNLAVIRGLLKRNHIQIETAESGEECLEMVKKTQYHIILMDYMMPQMDGAQTLKKFRNLEGNLSGQAPVLVLTANAISGVRESYLKEGFTDYLTKPLQSTRLEEMLQKYLPQEMVVPVDSYTVEMAEDVMSIRKNIAEEQKILVEAKAESQELEEGISEEECGERIRRIRECIQNFELDEALAELQRLEQLDMEKEKKELVASAVSKMQKQDYDTVPDILDKIERN